MNSYLPLAAIAYTAPFLLPHYLWPLIWLFGSFLFLALKVTNSWVPFALWSAIIWAIHLLPIMDTLLYMAPNHSWIGFLPGIGLIFYSASYTTLWLIISQQLIVSCRSLFGQLAVWICVLWAFLFFVEQLQFLPLGSTEGNLFASPLLPLATMPKLLAPLVVIPYPIVLLWLCTISATIALCWIEPKKLHLLLLGFLAAPWMALSLVTPKNESPPWLNTVGHLPLMLPASTSIYGGAAVIAHEIKQLQAKHFKLQTIIMPESAWNGINLTSTQKLPFITVENLLIGGFNQHGNDCYNTLYQFKRGHIATQTNKCHAMPLTERPLPWQTQNSLYFQKNSPTMAATHPRPLLDLPVIGSATAYICSELFCNPQPDDPHNCLIIAVASDWWIRHPHFAQLMALTARLKAIKWHRPILYISYRYAQFFDQYGHSQPIATTPANRMIG